MDEGHHLFSSLVSIIQTWWIGTSILTQSDSEYATQAERVTKSNNMSLPRIEHSRCDWLNHTTWFHSNPACPVPWNLSQYCFIFEHNTDANMLCRLFDNRKYMDIYISLYIRNTAILENKKSSPSNLVNCAKCSHNPSKDAADWSVVADFKSSLNFKCFFVENLVQSN